MLFTLAHKRLIIFNMPKVALITGVTGQDGAYLAEFLLNKGYEVHGVKRRSSMFNTDRIDHLYHDLHEKNVQFKLHYGDLTDSTNLIRIVQEVQPDEIYNLAAQSHVKVSFETPEYTANADAIGALRILEAIRILGLEKKTAFYQAGTSKCLDWYRKFHKKQRLFIHAVPTVSQKFTHIGSLKITAKLTACLPAMVFYLITKVRLEVKHLLPARSPVPPQK